MKTGIVKANYGMLSAKKAAPSFKGESPGGGGGGESPRASKASSNVGVLAVSTVLVGTALLAQKLAALDAQRSIQNIRRHTHI